MSVFFHQPTVDSLFKHLMTYEEVRNSLLTAILGERITYSETVDVVLNPFPAFKTLRDLVNRADIKALMEEIDILPEALTSDKKGSLTKKALKFMHDLAPLHAQLSVAIPPPERQTRLDIVCRSSYGLINVEMQVTPQNFYDLRILDHVCGLFNGQFSRGFKWDELEYNENVSEKIMRVVGISLFEKPPKYPENVQALLPWYQMRPWEDNELSRHFRLCDKKDPSLLRTGIEFMDFNLEAFIVLHANKGLGSYPKVLCEWLDFFARAHTKTMAQVEGENCSAPVRRAYEIIQDLSPELEERYATDLFNRENISFYVQGTREEALAEGEAKGKAEIARNLLSRGGLSLDEISVITGLSLTEVESLRS